MYSITPNAPNKDLVAYVSKPLIQSVSFNGFKYSYSPSVGKTLYVGGIHSKLKSIYYPDFEVKLRQYRRKGKGNKKKGSTKKQGILIDKQLKEYIGIGKTPRNMLAKALLPMSKTNATVRFKQHRCPFF